MVNDRSSLRLDFGDKAYDFKGKILKSYNEYNEILFIANEGVTSNKIPIYNVEKDDNDNVARNPISKTPVLLEKFTVFDVQDKHKNIERYIEREKKKNSISNRLKVKIMQLLKSIFLQEYIHEKQYCK